MKLLILGGKGLIGNAIYQHLIKNHDVYICEKGDSLSECPLETTEAVIDCARYENPCDQRALWHIVIDKFKRFGGGKLILFSSIYGHKAPDFYIYIDTEIAPTQLEYAMDKGAVEQATRYLAQRLKPYNIQVNCIAPGGVLDGHSEEFQDAYALAGEAPMIRTENILPVVDMLLNPVNAVNGQIITVDGGWSL
jgi:NAD(P)-dependent dehydrogenase (short-subunit alcohol dehydrogenase family)